MSKAKRQARKADRQEKRQNRQENRAAMRNHIKEAKSKMRKITPEQLEMAESPDAWKPVFSKIWTVVDPMLELSQGLITRDSIDNFIEEIQATGDLIAYGHSDSEDESIFLENLSEHWALIQKGFDFAQGFAGRKLDRVIQRIETILEDLVNDYRAGQEPETSAQD